MSLKNIKEDLSKVLGQQHGPKSKPSFMASSKDTVDIELADQCSTGPGLDNQGMKANVLRPPPETKQSSSTCHPEGRLSPLVTRVIKTVSKNTSEKIPGKHTTHMRARQSPYLNSNQERFFVPDFLVAWQESFPGYDPPSYTAQEIQVSSTWADTDIMGPGITSLVIKFNCDEDGINRRSYCGQIEVVDRLPRNPVGRTGIAGRGLFGRWGPNHAAHLIITRWKMDENEKITQKKGKSVLEFLALKSPSYANWTAQGWTVDEDENKKGKKYLELMPVEYPAASFMEWVIPGGMINSGDSVPEALTKSFRQKILPSLKPIIAKDTLRLHAIIQRAKEVYKGYVDDPRNTDNAWMETVTMNFHDETGKTLGDFEFEVSTSAYGANWQEVNSQINLQANQSFILRKVAELKDAYF